ncbi:MAG: GNAT family N-acetyltransferase [Treponema sp.]|nr:GNAT family N-acetyltransferase [Treponema sp.]
MKIRKAVLSDLPYLYEICLKTGDESKDATALFSDPYTIGHYYIAPYLVCPEGICFIVEHEYRPQGYIAAVSDTLSFKRWMEEQWLPPLRERYPLPFPPSHSDLEEAIIALFHKKQFPLDTTAQPWLVDYPAHLHIDLLPGIQGKGMGRALMEKLFAELAQKGTPGLHLGVGSSNANAVAFYKKTGFTVLQEWGWGYTMGKKIL